MDVNRDLRLVGYPLGSDELVPYRAASKRLRLPASDESHPPDTGCSVSPSCLCCPLPLCKYDDPPHTDERYGRITAEAKRAAAGGRLDYVQFAATRCGVSIRTAHRAVARLWPERT